MMRTLADVIMKGRNQAVMVVVIAAMLPLLYWISAAAVSLITLRRGVSDALKILIWALLPAFAWVLSGDPSAAVVIVSCFILATLLRTTASWQQVLIAIIPIGILVSYLLELGLGSLLDQIVEVASQLVAQRSAANSASALNGFSEDNIRNLILGAITAFHVAVMLGCLMLARSWQAGLYNPGGFQQEFHSLRLPIVFAVALVILLLAGNALLPNISRWYALLLLPLLVAGIALVHGVVAKRSLGKTWLVVLYLSLVFMGPYVVTLLVILALIDALLDLRARIPAGN